MHNKPSVSVSRDRLFRNSAKIGHDRPKQAVTPYRNDRSRLTEMGGHDGPKYAEVLIRRYQIDKDIKHKTAYFSAAAIARVSGPFVGMVSTARAVGATRGGAGSYLMATTRLRPNWAGRKSSHPQAFKQDLEKAFAFGHLLADITYGLDSEAVRGGVPMTLHLRDGQTLLLAGHLAAPTMPVEEMDRGAIQRREPLTADQRPVEVRSRHAMLNLRVHAELFIFIAQTGMNLQQAFQLRREEYRWRTVGEDIEAFRTYKGRRQGDAIFKAFKAYKAHLEIYRKWLIDVGFGAEEERLFPFLDRGVVRSETTAPSSDRIDAVCRQVGIVPVRARELRNTRVNWLLRRSGDPRMTSQLAANSELVLQRSYAQVNHQKAVSEIVRFHQSQETLLQSPGDGDCASESRTPMGLEDALPEAPSPDCISPDGCLFCLNHRDVESYDYCWRLASHRHLKALELSLAGPSPRRASVHPASRVIERINAKLQAMGSRGADQAQWVSEATHSVREGEFHPIWQSHIELAESIL